ncbi:hypothetical protein MK489_20380 [Myxococcota bacterium]|nr:hypothetical protein [Myxococcota bacterium]
MPILPLIDLLILMGSAFLAVGFVLKAVDITTRYAPTLLGFSSIDFVVMTLICLAFAITLAARNWVQSNEVGRAEGRTPEPWTDPKTNSDGEDPRSK